MSLTTELIGPELSELSALELENLPYLTLFTLLTPANIDQSVPNLATIYMPIRSQMSLIWVKLNQNIRSYMPLNLEKLLNLTLFIILSSTNINQSAPNSVRMHPTIRSRMSLIMDLIRPELPELSALELENLPYLTLFTL